MLARFEASPQTGGSLAHAEEPGETLPATDSQIEGMMRESDGAGSTTMSPADGKNQSPSTPSVAPSDSVSKAESSDEEPYYKLVLFLYVMYIVDTFENQMVMDIIYPDCISIIYQW